MIQCFLEDCFNQAGGPGCGIAGGYAAEIRFNFASTGPLTPGATYVLEPFEISGDSFAAEYATRDVYSSGAGIFNGAVRSDRDLWFREGRSSKLGTISEGDGAGAATATVSRNSDTSDDLIVTLTSNDTTEATLVTTVTIPAGQTTSAPFDIDAVDDLIADGTQTVTFTASASGHADGTDTLDVTDDDEAGINVSAISGNTTEAGGTATFTVALDSEPTADVTIGISSSDGTEGTVSTSSLVFTPANWNTPQTVTVTGVNDSLDDGNIAYWIVTAPASSGDSSYNGLNAADVPVTNLDNDASGITVSSISGDTTEAGGTATFTIVLDSQPIAEVLIGISSDDPSEGTVSTSIIRFLPSNWSTPQVITVTGADDDVADGNTPYKILTAPANSNDTRYNGVKAADVDVTNIDDDTAGISVSAISGNTTEAGGTATFTVKLDSEPTADVTFSIASSDTAEGSVSTSSLTFTTANWNTSQIVTVAGVDDDVDDGNIGFSIVTGAASSIDSNYDGLDAADVTLTNIDDDTAGITVSAVSGNTTEAGGAANFAFQLNSEPTSNVTISLSSSNTSEGTLSTTTLVFTSANWDVAQSVTVTGVDDAIDDGDVVYHIITTVLSGDTKYSGLSVADRVIVNHDDDTAGITVDPTTGLVVREGGATDTVTLVLNSQPTANVTISLSSSDPNQVTVFPGTLTFTAANWMTPQAVTIEAIDDDIDENTLGIAVLTSPAVSGDPKYDGLDAIDTNGSLLDNDTRGVIVSSISGNTTESGGTATFSIVLASEPTALVEIPLSSSNAAEGTVDVASVAFLPGNWNIPQIVTVTGQDDSVVDGNVSYSIVTGAIGGSSDYVGINANDVAIINVDDDTAGITVSAISGDTTEAGGTATFSVALSSEPTSDVTIGISSSDTTEGTVSAASLVFTASNWNIAQTLTITGVDDAIVDGDIVYDVIISAAVSDDSNYGGLDAADVTVKNIDDDVVEVLVSPVTGSTTEDGGTATFAISLNALPTSEVTIALSSTDPGEGIPGVSEITFDASDWNAPHIVTITGVDDLFVDGDIVYTIVTAAVVSGDARYDGLDPSDVLLTNLDNDVPLAVSYFPQSGTLVGGGTSYTTGLEPTADPFEAAALRAVDGSVQSVTEGESLVGGSKKPKTSSALDYYLWSFGSVVNVKSFSLYAWRNVNAEGDDFRFEYSLDGGAWTPLVIVGSATGQSYDVDLSATPLTGDLMVRVVDTDRSPVARNATPSLESIYVDLISFDSVTTDLRPLVDIIATDGSAFELPFESGQFTVTREGTSGDLQVFYTVSGSATSDLDYVALTGIATIPDGQTATTITINPLDDSDAEGNETVVVTLLEGSLYKPGANDSAAVTIIDDDLQIFVATSENAISSTVIANDFASTAVADGVVETIEEERTGGKPSSRKSFMDHRWTFVGVNAAQSFYLTASRPNNSEGDDFEFQYSSDSGETWESLATITTPSLTLYPVALPSAISGTIQVRVIDTDPDTTGNGDRDSVNVDQMYFSTAPLAPLVAEPSTSATGGWHLTTDELDTLSHQAITFWQRQESHPLAAVDSPITFEIAQIANPYLGLAYRAEGRIQIDIDAAGFGWNRESLFSTLVHEVGHLYGYDHEELGGSLSVGNHTQAVPNSLALPLQYVRPYQVQSALLPNQENTTASSGTDNIPWLNVRSRAQDTEFIVRAGKSSTSVRFGATGETVVDELFAYRSDEQLEDELLQLLAESRADLKD